MSNTNPYTMQIVHGLVNWQQWVNCFSRSELYRTQENLSSDKWQWQRWSWKLCHLQHTWVDKLSCQSWIIDQIIVQEFSSNPLGTIVLPVSKLLELGGFGCALLFPFFGKQMHNVYFHVKCALSQLVYNQPGIQQVFDKRIVQHLQIWRKTSSTRLWYIMKNVLWFEFLITCKKGQSSK